MTPKPSLALLFLSILASQHLRPAAAACNADDESGLLGFKSGITQDPSGILSSWKAGTDCCNWIGVSCGADSRVSSLFIYGQTDKANGYLSGTISASLSKLRGLDGIYLQGLRNVSGPFPRFLFSLPKLQYVYIENNRLSGPIPRDIGRLTRLEALSLADNRFTGPIPSSISGLTRLTQLKLGGNLLSGRIPHGIQQLKNLTFLSLDRNQLSGTIPDKFGSFSNLRVLRLSNNKLSGGIPPSVAALAPKLSYLELGHNSLTGKIPDFLGKFTALDTLDLSWNRFAGAVPGTFGNLTKIFNLNLSHNALTDPFPEMNVKGIESLDLSYNKFRLGKIPKWVATSPIIYSLKLAGCGIKMSLDDWNPSETYFYDYIDLSDNEISGSPLALLNRTQLLVGFWARGNRLRFDMGKLKLAATMKHLDLSRNLAFGKVPAAVAGLQTLNVSNNHLCGQLPATKFPASSFVGNDCLCGSPLPPCKG